MTDEFDYLYSAGRAKVERTFLTRNISQGSALPVGPHVAAAGFHVLVLCAEQFQPPDNAFPGIQVIRAPLIDDQHNVMPLRSTKLAMKAAREVAARMKNGENVLVTCLAGLNRSGFVSVVALHLTTGYSGKRMIQFIQKRRPDALFNQMFVKMLEALPDNRAAK